MGKHNKKRSSAVNNSSSDPKNKEAERGKNRDRIDLLTSQLLDLCSSTQPNQQQHSLWNEYSQIIRPKLDELRSIQSEAAENIFQRSQSDDDGKRKKSRSDILNVMADWCRKNGAKIHHQDQVGDVSVFSNDDEDENNCGLRCGKLLDVGDIVLKVPRRLFLSYENVVLLRTTNESAARKMFDCDPLLKGMPNVALTMLVVIEKLKGADSFWSSYLASLPTNYSTSMPLYFLIEDGEKFADNIRGSSTAFEETLKLCKNIVRQYAYFYQRISSQSSGGFVVPSIWADYLKPNKFVFDLYLWSAVTVMTRINFVPSSSEAADGKIPALIPLFDMANHGDVPPCTDFLDQNQDHDQDDDQQQQQQQYAVIYASIRYQPGDQILINYGGERKYWEFFVYNGFVYEKSGAVIVKLGLSPSDRLLDLKSAALKRYDGLGQQSQQFSLSSSSSKPDDQQRTCSALERFAIIFCCSNKEELEAFCNCSDSDSSNDDHVDRFTWNTETVMAARKFLITRLSLLLSAYSLSNKKVIVDDHPPATCGSAEGAAGGAAIAIEKDQKRERLTTQFVKGEMDALKACIQIFQGLCN